MRLLGLLICALLAFSGGVRGQEEGPKEALSLPCVYNVRDFGAVGDGLRDDTEAFQAALEAARATGGTVLVPPVTAGQGYVLTRTVRVPRSVALVGSLAGLTNNSWSAYDLPDSNVVGCKIFARPAPDQWQGEAKAPLFWLEGGCTVRGLFILYDQQPWPSDEQFQDKASPFYYESFEAAREGFERDHVKPYGPTFYADFGTNIVLEDLQCDRYYDFLYFRQAGRCWINRIALYGYKRGFTLQEIPDVVRIQGIHMVPNVGPACPGPTGPGRTYTWIYALCASDPEQIGFQFGNYDGLTLMDLTCFGMHTGIQFGASKAFPVNNPVENVDCYWDEESGKPVGFRGNYAPGTGPWGAITDLKLDQVCVGLHFVWPSPLTVRLTNCLIFPAFDDGQDFEAAGGSGNLTGVARQAAFLVEPTYSAKFSGGYKPVVMGNNVVLASFNDSGRFAPASADCRTANGRAFLLGGDVTMDFTGLQLYIPYGEDLLWARGSASTDASVKLRGFILAGEPKSDIEFGK